MGKARRLQRLKSKGLGPEYTRQILDALCEKVTANNVNLSPEWRPRMLVLPEFKKWERVKKIQTDVYLIAEEYGIPFDEVDRVYRERQYIFKLYRNSYLREEHNINEVVCMYILADKFGINRDALILDDSSYDNFERSIEVLRKMYPDVHNIYWSYYVSGNEHPKWDKIEKMERYVTEEEYVDEFKRVIREYPEQCVSFGLVETDYAPSDGFFMKFNPKYDPRGEWMDGTRNLMSKIPFILFRQNGITLSENECVGWHVEHRATYKAKLTQKRFDMCMEKISEMDGKDIHNYFSMMY